MMNAQNGTDPGRQTGEFLIHERLLADCHLLGRMTACHLLLHRNAALPWFILVPETPLQDLLDLPPKERENVLTEAAAVSAFVKESLGYPKINFAAIGNLVPQLHLHVIGRRPGDPCWPAPVWGHLEDSSPYSESRVSAFKQAMGDYLALRPSAGPA